MILQGKKKFQGNGKARRTVPCYNGEEKVIEYELLKKLKETRISK
jgi:hypothetical protein